MPNSLNLVYFINSLNAGGAQIGMSRLLDGLDKTRFDVTVIVLDGRVRRQLVKIPDSVELIKLSPAKNQSLSTLFKTVRKIAKADVIVGSMYHSSIIAALCSAINKRATVAIWQHSTNFKNDMRKSVYRKAGSYCDVILADSEPVREMLDDRMNLNNAVTVPIAGIDPSNYSQVSHGPRKTISVGTVGNLRKAKNYSTVLTVAERLQNEAIEFNIAGEGDLYDSIQRVINKKKLDHVNLHGFVDDIPSFLSNLDIYFQPSYFEGLCITVIEAMAAGLPVIGSNVGGIKYNVTHGETGQLFSPTNVNQFEKAIRKFADDPSLRQKYGTNAREEILETYTQEVLVSKFQSAITRY